MQAEVCRRLAAPPGSKVYGVRVTVKAAWYAEVKRAGAIGRNCLLARPERRLRLVSLVRRAKPIETTATKAEVFAVVDSRVRPAAPRRCAPRSPAGRGSAARRPRWSLAGVSPQARGESLTVDEFVGHRRAKQD
ncbi:hypothetical protein GCM10020221_01190 [Streptomyces thioluteus]|uniref:Transposase n=1 Tax=Streptomyces thioluteus TaxID=66431 RepID=A0ABP6ITE1_STRTU